MGKKVFFVLGAILLLVGCSTPNETKKELKSSTSSSSSTSSTASSSSREKKADSSSSSISVPKSSTSNSAESVANSSTESVTTQETKQKESVNTYPYEVSFDRFKENSVFGRNGMNIPNVIEFSNESEAQGTITFKNGGPEGDFVTSYAFYYQQIPTRTIRIFSADTSEIRTVNVNTELVLGERLFSDQDRVMSGNLYVFVNKSGSLSLVTPNYAGNVTEKDFDVMVEYLPR